MTIASPSPLKPEILNYAVAVAMASTSRRRVGSVLLNKKRIISTATNYDKKTHPIQGRYAKLASKCHNNAEYSNKIYLHSEILCLIRAKEKCDTIVVARMGGHNYSKLSNSRPCPLCELYLRHHGVKKIHYSTPNGFMYEKWE